MRNSLRPQDLKFVLMVGGSNLHPIRSETRRELLGIPVNTGINPTNAIVVGAAYFAASKEIDLGKPAEPAARLVCCGLRPLTTVPPKTRRRFSQPRSRKCRGPVLPHYGADGGYDSGLKTLAARISEDLPLQEAHTICSALKIFDGSGNHVAADVDPIEIAQGKCPPPGQAVPHDLSLVLDDLNTGDTALYIASLPRTALFPQELRKR